VLALDAYTPNAFNLYKLNIGQKRVTG